MIGELPLRIIDQPGGPVIRCLCGVESARVTAASDGAAPIVRAARRLSAPARGLAPDVSPGALLRMVAHAKACRNLPASSAP